MGVVADRSVAQSQSRDHRLQIEIQLLERLLVQKSRPDFGGFRRLEGLFEERQSIPPAIRFAVDWGLREQCVELLALRFRQGAVDDVAQYLLALIQGRDDQVG